MGNTLTACLLLAALGLVPDRAEAGETRRPARDPLISMDYQPRPVDNGQPVLFRLKGAFRQVKGTFMGKKLRFSRNPKDRNEWTALAAVSLWSRKRTQRVKLLARGKKGWTALSFPIGVGRHKYPLTKVVLKPTKKPRPRERRIYGGKILKKAAAQVTRKRYWELPFVRPLNTRITEIYGVRRIYMRKRKGKVYKRWRGRHYGLDLDGNGGEPIPAINHGVVAAAGYYYGTGKCVVIDHGQRVFSYYYHMSDIKVKTGDRIKKGQVVGLVGATGAVSGPHLHLGVRVNGDLIDPMVLFKLGR